MEPGKETIEYIDRLLVQLSEPNQNPSSFKYVEELIGECIPNIVKNLLASENTVSSNIDIFCGYELENIETITKHYLDMKNRNSVSFFAGNFVDDNFEASEDCGITYYDEHSGSEHYQENDEVNNLRKILPLFDASGAYSIVMNLGGECPGELLVVTQDYTFSVLAPSLEAHLIDLAAGIENKIYQLYLDEEYPSVEYPMSWGARKLVMSGEYFMDEYCELIKK